MSSAPLSKYILLSLLLTQRDFCCVQMLSRPYRTIKTSASVPAPNTSLVKVLISYGTTTKRALKTVTSIYKKKIKVRLMKHIACITWCVKFCLQRIWEKIPFNCSIILPFIQPTTAGEAQFLSQRWSINVHPVKEPTCGSSSLNSFKS